MKDKAIDWIKKYFPSDKPILYVLGNHEFWRKAHPKLIDTLKEKTAGTNIHVLENDVFEYEGVNFLGCTLWTDFDLLDELEFTMSECHLLMSDYDRIRISPSFHKASPVYFAQVHNKSRYWLSKELIAKKGQKNVVITHHTPSPHSLPDEDKGKYISAAYASSMHEFIDDHKPDLWLHGHVHESFKYWVCETQIVRNPRGYWIKDNPKINAAFDPSFTIEI